MPRHPQKPHRPSSADQRSGERCGERMALARRTRDELANNAWLRFLCEVSTAWDSAKNEAALERIRAAVQPGARKRRLGRLGRAMLQALLALSWEMLLAVSFPVVALLIQVVVQLGVYAFVAYVIYKLLTVW